LKVLSVKPLVTQLLRSLVQPGEVEEGAQRVFVEMALRWSVLRFLLPRDTRRYVVRIVYGISGQLWREASSRLTVPAGPGDVLDIVDENANPEADVETMELIDRLPGVLHKLSPERRAVFVTCEFDDLTIREAAHRLQIPVGTASSRLAKARADLKMIGARLARSLSADSSHNGATFLASNTDFDDQE